MNADIGEKDFDGHDGEMRNYFTGSIEKNDLTLYDFDRDSLMNLVIKGNSFKAFDFETETFYEGILKENKVSLWDLNQERLFRFSLQ